MSRSSIKYEDLIRIEPLLQSHPKWEDYNRQMMDDFYKPMWEEKHKTTKDFMKSRLGKQDHTIQFRHRNWVWHRPQWTAFVDTRGLALCVPRGGSPETAWEAWQDFIRVITLGEKS